MRSSISPAGPIVLRARTRLRSFDSRGDRVLYAVCAIASLLAAAVILVIAYEVFKGAHVAISRFGLGFLGHTAWKPNFGVFGAGTVLYGSAVSSFLALLLATPIGISIGLYLSMLAPRGVRGVIGPLVELLAAIPSVI